MAEITKKRSRKDILVPRTEVDIEDYDYAEILRLQNSVQEVSSLMKQATSNNSKQSSNIQFAVDVMVEELNEDDTLNNSKDAVARAAYKFEAKQVVINKHKMWVELDRISKTILSYTDKKLAIEVRNSWGRLEKQQIEQSPKETLLQVAIVKWTTWVISEKAKKGQRGLPLSYKCYACNKAWWRLMPFRDHIEQHPEDHLDVDIETGLYECNIIAFFGDDRDKRFINIQGPCPKCLNGVQQHEFYKCSDCPLVFATCTTLYKHRMECGRNTTFSISCSICNYKCCENDYKAHLSTHTVPSDEPMDSIVKIHSDCGSKYIIYNLHPCLLKSRNVYCDYCPRKFHSQLFAKLHMEIADSDVTCQVCRELLPRACMEVEHLAAHSKDFCMVYKCSLCPMPVVFPDDVSAKYHMLAWHDKIETRNRTYNDMVIVPKKIVALWRNIDPMDPNTLHAEDFQRETDEAVLSLKNLNYMNEADNVNNSSVDANTNGNNHDTRTDKIMISISDIKTEDTDCNETVEDSQIDFNETVEVSEMEVNESVVDSQTDFNETVENSQIDFDVTKEEPKLKVDLSIVKTEKDYDFDIQIDGQACSAEEFEIKKEMVDCDELLSNIYRQSNAHNKFNSHNEFKACNESNAHIDEDFIKQSTFTISQRNTAVKQEIKLDSDDFDEDDLIILRPPESIFGEENIYGEIQERKPEINMFDLEPVVPLTSRKKKKIYNCNKCKFNGHHKQYKKHILEVHNRKRTIKLMVTDSLKGKKEALRNSQIMEPCYSCTKCNLEYTFHRYIKHFTVHGLPENCCPKCNVIYPEHSTLAAHIRFHIHSSFISVRIIEETREVSNIKMYQCIKCRGKVQKQHMFAHWETHLDIGKEESWEIVEENAKDVGELENVDSALPVEKLKKVIDHVLRNGSDRGKRVKPTERCCVVCLRSFDRHNDCKRHLVQHLLTDAYAHRGKYDAFKCQICGDMLEKIDKFRQHMRDHACLPIYKCELCDKMFSDSSNFTKHKKVHNLQMYTCDLCGKKFQAKVSIENHMLSHNKSPPVDCEFCGKHFSWQSDYKRHRRLIHLKSRTTFSCPICRKKFENCRTKWDHMWYVHKARNRKADCLICGKGFRKLTDLNNHTKKFHTVIDKVPPCLIGKEQKPKNYDKNGVNFKYVRRKGDEVLVVIDG